MKKLLTPLSLAFLLSACAGNPNAYLEQTLAQLPTANSHGQSLVELDVAQLHANTQTPAQIAVAKSNGVTFADFEKPLTAVRGAAVANDKPMRSLSYYASQSLLENCSQVCGLKISEKQGVAGQFVTFNCDDTILNLREYYQGAGKQGFTLTRDKVNILINGQPASLQRTQSPTGEGATFLAWQGADRGLALFSASASDETAQKLVAIAQSLAKVEP